MRRLAIHFVRQRFYRKQSLLKVQGFGEGSPRMGLDRLPMLHQERLQRLLGHRWLGILEK
jgi:hypothetical protein